MTTDQEIREIAMRFAVTAAAPGTEAHGNPGKIVGLAEQFVVFLDPAWSPPKTADRNPDGDIDEVLNSLSPKQAEAAGPNPEYSQGDGRVKIERADMRPVANWMHQVALDRVNDLERELKETQHARDRLEQRLELVEHQRDKMLGHNERMIQQVERYETRLNKLRDMVLNGEF
jgi:hypothetical protein